MPTQQDYKKTAINSPYDFSLAYFFAKVYTEKFIDNTLKNPNEG